MYRCYSKFLCALFVPLTISLLSAQEEADLRQDQGFFQTQAKTYQAWLDDSGIGKVLKVHAIEVEDKSLSVYLSFYTDDDSKCWAQWEQLKLDFAAVKDIGLEQQLFYKMITIMDVRQSIANVQIYDTYDLSREPCFFVGIEFDKTMGKVKVSENACRSETVSVTVSPNDLEGLSGATEDTVAQILPKATIFSRVLDFAENKYLRKTCEQRDPKIVVLENDEVLRFRVEDLCLEVLKDQSNNGLCWMINRVCYKRERLTYIVTYQRESNGIKVGIEIDGRYGSGWFKQVGRDGYHLMDEHYKGYLQDYASVIREELRPILRKK